MKKKKYKIIAILGLNCGKLSLDHLIENNDINLHAVYCLHPKKSANVAGYIDLKKDTNFKYIYYYKSTKDLENKIIKQSNIDATIAFGISDILSKQVLQKPKIATLGAHAAKLPDRPGCSPIIWAILDNLKETEMTLFRMTEKIDQGLIYDRKKIKINNNSNATELRLEMDHALKYLLEKNLMQILSRKNTGYLKKGTRNYTRKRSIKDGQLFFNESAQNILLKIRALNNPYPGAHFYAGDGRPIIIDKARIGSKSLNYIGSGSNIKKTILCIVAHPDDEALGIGGTLIKHKIFGDDVYIIILSEGEDSKLNSSPKNKLRYENAKDWANFTNCILHQAFNFPDQGLDKVPLLKMVKLIEQAIENLKPDIIYTHHPGDINSDHQIVSQVTLTASRPISYHKISSEIRVFETPSSTDQGPKIEPFLFKPNFYVSLNDEIFKKKIIALRFYKEELRKYPHPRSIESIKALAKKRGSESGFKYAEAITILRKNWS